jgi:hypothetical protein
MENSVKIKIFRMRRYKGGGGRRAVIHHIMYRRISDIAASLIKPFPHAPLAIFLFGTFFVISSRNDYHIIDLCS